MTCHIVPSTFIAANLAMIAGVLLNERAIKNLRAGERTHVTGG